MKKFENFIRLYSKRVSIDKYTDKNTRIKEQQNVHIVQSLYTQLPCVVIADANEVDPVHRYIRAPSTGYKSPTRRESRRATFATEIILEDYNGS